jgi:LysR family transcriptional regulator for metE and metH
MPLLEVKDLRVVLALASAGSTKAAASALALTQPAVSRALLLAEEKLGTRLFERTPRGLSPTPAAERFIEGATRLLLELKEIERRAQTKATPPKTIRLVCGCYTAYHWLPSVLASLQKTLPDLRVTIAVEHTVKPIEALLQSKIDVALLTTSIAPDLRAAKQQGQGQDIAERPLFHDELLFVVGQSHPLAAKKSITPSELRAAKILTFAAPRPEVDWFFRRVFGRTRPRLNVDLLPLTEAALDLARAGMGIAIVSDWVLRPHLGQGDLLPKRLSRGPLLRPWHLAWRSEHEDSALRLLSALQNTMPRAPLGGRTLGD